MAEQQKYKQKLAELQKYVPFLEKMISHLKNTKEGSREVQLTKMESLHSMITNKNKKLKYDILLKCEEVIVKLQSRMCSNVSSNSPNEADIEEIVSKKSVNASKVSQQKHSDAKNSEKPPAAEKKIENPFRSVDSKVHRNKNEKDKEPEIKEEEESDVERMSDFPKSHRGDFHGKRYIRNAGNYGRKYRPFCSTAKQNATPHLMVDDMVNDLADPYFSQQDFREYEDFGNSNANYRRYSTPPLDDLAVNYRDRYNDYVEDARIGSSSRYSPDFLEAERLEHERVNDRRQTWWEDNNTDNHDLFENDARRSYELQNYERENYEREHYECENYERQNYPRQYYEQADDRISPTIGGNRRGGRNFDRETWFDRNESNFKRNHYQPGRKSFRGSSRFKSGNNFKNPYKKGIGDQFEDEDSGKPNITNIERINGDNTLNIADTRMQDTARKMEIATVTSEQPLRNDPRMFSANYKHLMEAKPDKLSKPQVPDCVNTKMINIRQNDLLSSETQAQNIGVQNTQGWRNFEFFKRQNEEVKPFGREDSSSSKAPIVPSMGGSNFKVFEANAKEAQKEIKHKKPDEAILRMKPNVRSNPNEKIDAKNITRLEAVTSYTKQDVENIDKSAVNDAETLKYSKLDQMYSNLGTDGLFSSPLKALYSENKGPKNFKIPKKQNPIVAKKIETSETEISIKNNKIKDEEQLPKTRKGKTKTKKKIIIFDDDTDEEADICEPKRNKLNAEMPKSKLTDVVFEEDNQIDTKVKKRKSSTVVDDKAKRSKLINKEPCAEISNEKIPEKSLQANPTEDNSSKLDDVKSESVELKHEKLTQELPKPDLKSIEDCARHTVNPDNAGDNTNDENSVKMEETSASQGVKEVKTDTKQQTKEEVVKASNNKLPETNSANSIDVLEFILKNYKQIKKIFKDDSSSDEEHTTKKAKKKKKKRKKYSSSSSSSSDAEEEKRKKAKKDVSDDKNESKDTTSKVEMSPESIAIVDNKDDTPVEDEPAAKDVFNKKSNLKGKSRKNSSDLDNEVETPADKPATKELLNKKGNLRGKSRKNISDVDSEVDIPLDQLAAKEVLNKKGNLRGKHRKNSSDVDDKVDTPVDQPAVKEIFNKKGNLRGKSRKNSSDVLEETSFDVTVKIPPIKIPLAKEEAKKKINPEQKHRKSELDILHESIKEMFMSDDIVRATGKRSCTVSKEQIELPPAKVKNIESIEKFIANASKLRVLLRREDFTKLLNKESVAKEVEVSIIKTKEKIKPKRKRVSFEGVKVQDEQVAAVEITPAPIQNTVKPPVALTADLPPPPIQESILPDPPVPVLPPVPKKIVNKPKRRPIQNTLQSHHDKNYFVHEERTYCRFCSFWGKLIIPHYKTRHRDQEVLASRMDPLITERLIGDSKDKNYDSMVLEERPKAKHFYACPFCQVNLASDYIYNFYDHLTTHTGEYRFCCGVCDYTWHNSSCLNQHYSKHDNKTIIPPRQPPPYSAIVFGYVCTTCNYVQTVKENVEKHVQHYHENNAEIVRVNLNLALEPEKDNDTVTVTSNDTNDGLDFTVNRFLEVKLEESEDVDVTSLDTDRGNDAMVKVEDNQIQVARVGNYLNDSNKDKACSKSNLTAFVCETNIVDQKVEERRLEKMNEILENVNVPRASLADKLQTKLVSNETQFIKTPCAKRILQQPVPVLDNCLDVSNIQAQKAKPSRTFIAENKQGTNSEINPEVNVIEAGIANKTRPILSPKLPDLTLNCLWQETDARKIVTGNVTVPNKKFTPISNIINRLQDNLQPNLQKKVIKTDVNGSDNDNSLPENPHASQSQMNNSPPPLIHYKELLTEEIRLNAVPKLAKAITVQPPIKTYQRLSKVSNSNNKNLTASSPYPSNHTAVTSNKKSSPLLIAGPIKLVTGKSGNVAYSCMDCQYLTESSFSFEKHCCNTHDSRVYESWSCNKCEGVFAKSSTFLDIFDHVKQKHLDLTSISNETDYSMEDSGVENISNRDSSPNSSLFLQNSGGDSKYQFVITSIKSLANDPKVSTPRSVDSEIQNSSPVPSSDDDKPPALKPIENQVSKIRPVPIFKLLDNVEDDTGIPSLANVYKPVTPRKTLFASDHLLDPKNLVHFYKCPVYDCSFSCFGQAEFYLHLPLHPETTVFCLYCNSLLQLSTYTTHLDNFHGNSRYACSLCFYRATSPSLVKTHIGMVHSAAKKVMIIETPLAGMGTRSVQAYEYPTIKSLIKPYVCGEPDCKMETIFSSTFLEHYFSLHYSKKKMACGQCDDKLHKGILQHYWTIHDIYPYNCRYCPSGSHKINIVVQHQTIRHNNLPMCIISRSPKKGVKKSPKSKNEYEDIQILFEKTINLNKLNVNITEMPPVNTTKNDNYIVSPLNTTLSNLSTTSPVTTTTEINETQAESSDLNELGTPTASLNQNEVDDVLADFFDVPLESNEEFEELGNARDELCSTKFPNTTFSGSIEDAFEKSEVPKETTRVTRSTASNCSLRSLRPLLPAIASSNTTKFSNTKVSGSVEDVLEKFVVRKKTSRSTTRATSISLPLWYKASAMTDGTIYPSCQVCGVQVVKRRCTHYQSKPLISPTTAAKIVTMGFVSKVQKTFTLRKIISDLMVIPEYKPLNRFWCIQPGCNKHYKTVSTFSRHLRLNHAKDKSYNCHHCGITIETQSKQINLLIVSKHFELHGPNLFQCPHCHFVDTYRRAMETHISIIHPSKSSTDFVVIRASVLKKNNLKSTELPIQRKSETTNLNASVDDINKPIVLNSLSLELDDIPLIDRVNEKVSDPLEITVSDSDDEVDVVSDNQICENIVNQGIFVESLPEISNEISENGEYSANECIDTSSFKTDLYNPPNFDRLKKLLEEKLNNSEDEEDALFIDDFKNGVIKTKNNLKISDKPSVSENDSFDVETIIIDDDDDADESKTNNEEVSQFQSTECETITLVFDNKSLIEEDVPKEGLLAHNLNAKTLTSDLQKTKSTVNEDDYVSDVKGETKDTVSSAASPTFGKPIGPYIKPSLNFYKCPVCYYTTTYSKEFYSHLTASCTQLKKEETSSTNRADWARLVLIIQTKIMNYWKDTYDSEESLCRFCHKLVAKSTLIRHEHSHFTVKPFCCLYCSYTCVNEIDMVYHKQQHRTIKSPLYDPAMTKSFPIKPVLSGTSNDIFLMELLDGSDLEDLDEPITSYLQTMMCRLCDYTGSDSYLGKDSRITRFRYVCQKCDKTFVDQNSLKLHTRTHFNIYKCKYCEFSTCTFRLLRKHYFDSHPQEHFEYLYDFSVECLLNKAIKKIESLS